MEISAILKNRRETLGLSLDEVAEMVGVNRSTISRWENGDVENMRREKISKLADALKIDPLVILGREKPDITKLDVEQTAKEIISLLDEEDIKLIKELKDSDDEKAKLKLYAMLINKISQL